MPPSGARRSTISSMNVRMMKMPRPLDLRTFSGARGSGIVVGSNPGPSSRTRIAIPAGAGITEGCELDVDVLALVVAVPVLDGVDHRLAHRDAHPMQGIVIETGQAPQVVACHLHEVEHFVGAVKIQTDCFPLRHAPRQRKL